MRLLKRKKETKPRTQESYKSASEKYLFLVLVILMACGSLLSNSKNIKQLREEFQKYSYDIQNITFQIPGIDGKSPDIANATASPNLHGNVGRLPKTITNSQKKIEGNTTSASLSNSFQWQDIDLDDPTAAWPNLTTKAFCCGGFYSGFRNQIMAFTGMVFNTVSNNIGQILLESIREKDTYGSNKYIPFEKLWDVPHWNSHYPLLPRLVHYNPVIHDQYDLNSHYWYKLENGTWTDSGGVNAYEDRRRPIPSAQQHRLFGKYQRYAKGKGDWPVDGHRRPEEKLMISGAMRPHPKLREIIEKCQNSLMDGESGGKSEYMTLHARIEPDMQKHPVCRDKKVLNLTKIFDFIEAKWPKPPVRSIFMPINRQFLEKEGSDDVVNTLKEKNKSDEINWIAVENLRVLNQARDDGLWGGRVKVFEFGEKVLKDTEYSKTPSTTASLVNFFISIGAKIFIGTEVSSYSHDLLATRFFMDNMENHKYLPDGLHDWTPPGLVDPPGHGC